MLKVIQDTLAMLIHNRAALALAEGLSVILTFA